MAQIEGLPPYIIGLSVMLRTGGPKMKVTGFDTYDGKLTVAWTGPGGEDCSAEFHRHMLRTWRSAQKTPAA